MADSDASKETETAPEAMHSEVAGNTQAKRAATAKGRTPAAVNAATTTKDAGNAGRVGEQALAADAPRNPPPVPGSNRSSVAPIDPITATPEIFVGKGESPVGTPRPNLAPNYTPTRYVDFEGNDIKSADGLFEEFGSATLVRVTGRVSEIVEARNATAPHRRLLWAVGTEVPKTIAEDFKAAVGK